MLVLALAVFILAPRFLGDKTEQELSTTATNFTGVITAIDSSELNDVSNFEVRHDGKTTTVYVRADFDYGFPIGHLQEHLASGDPVTVEGELIDGKFYADAIEDA